MSRLKLRSILRQVIYFSLVIGALFVIYLIIHQGRTDGRIGTITLTLALIPLIYAVWRLIQLPDRRTLPLSLVIALLATSALFIFAIFSMQTQILFAPVPGNFDACTRLTEQGYKPLKVKFENEPLRAFTLTRADAKGWLLIFHGNAESACYDDKYVTALSGLSMNLVFAEYPGYKNDSGLFTESNYLSNALALRHWVGGEARSLPVFIMGRSLGTSLATYVASKELAAGLIVISPFTSIEELAPNAFPFFPRSLMRLDKFRAWQWAEKVQAPTLVLHGTADQLIPVEMGRAESTHFPHLVQFQAIKDASHNGIASKESPIWAMIQSFIALRLGPTQ